MNLRRVENLERHFDAAAGGPGADSEVVIYVPDDGRNPAVSGRHGNVVLYDPDAGDPDAAIAGQKEQP